VCIILTWQYFSPDVTVKGFKKCYIYNAVAGTDDMLRNVIAEDGNVSSEA